MATLEEFRSDIDACRTAINAGNYVNARISLVSARAALASIPDSEMNEEKLVWDRSLRDLETSIKQLENDATRAKNTEGPFIFTPIEQVRE